MHKRLCIIMVIMALLAPLPASGEKAESIYTGVPGQFRRGTKKEKLRQDRETAGANARYEAERAQGGTAGRPPKWQIPWAGDEAPGKGKWQIPAPWEEAAPKTPPLGISPRGEVGPTLYQPEDHRGKVPPLMLTPRGVEPTIDTWPSQEDR